jgi:hypothetical protein
MLNHSWVSVNHFLTIFVGFPDVENKKGAENKTSAVRPAIQLVSLLSKMTSAVNPSWAKIERLANC